MWFANELIIPNSFFQSFIFMVAIPNGDWAILSIAVDNQSVHSSEGFERIEMSETGMTIRPSGMTFTVQQATKDSAVLESQGQVFFADFKTSQQDQQLNLRLTRPQFAETIDIQAQYDA